MVKSEVLTPKEEPKITFEELICQIEQFVRSDHREEKALKIISLSQSLFKQEYQRYRKIGLNEINKCKWATKTDLIALGMPLKDNPPDEIYLEVGLDGDVSLEISYFPQKNQQEGKTYFFSYWNSQPIGEGLYFSFSKEYETDLKSIPSLIETQVDFKITRKKFDNIRPSIGVSGMIKTKVDSKEKIKKGKFRLPKKEEYSLGIYPAEGTSLSKESMNPLL